MPLRMLPLLLLGLVPLAFADGPADNIPEKVRPIPPKGVEIPQADRQEIEAKLKALTDDLAALPGSLKGKPALLELLPDVEVYHKAVAWALKYGEVYSAGELKNLVKLIQTGRDRADALRAGKPAWTRATGLVVRGFRSKIDGSVQPYGLVVPETFEAKGPRRHRLDVWLHGRGERTTEVGFILGRSSSRGEFAPADAFVMHPFGRYSNAFKMSSRRSTTCASTTASTTTASSCAASRWAGRAAGRWRRTTPAAGPPPLRGRGSARRSSS
jgi:hypothetical protein